MKRHNSAASFALTVLAILGATDPAAAGKQVPFKGSLDAEVTLTFLAFPEVIVLADGTGNATHLGRFTYTNENLVNRETMTSNGFYEFTAANGDMVYATCTGESTLTTVPGVLHTVETATITGGTGRFAHATGGFVTDRLLNAGAGWTTGSFEGTISNGGASKH